MKPKSTLKLEPVGEVRQLLEDIALVAASSLPRSHMVADLLKLFQEFPSLSNRLYDVDIGLSNPLHCFLRAGEELDSVQTLCKSCPNLLELFTTEDIQGNTPTCLACQYGSTDVIHYLIQQYKLMGGTTKYGSRWFQRAIENTNRDISLETLDLLWSLCNEDHECWELALMSHQPEEVLHWMVGKHIQGNTYLPIRAKTQFQGKAVQPLTLGQARALVQLCNTKVEHLLLDYPAGWECNTFAYFLSALRTNQSLRVLEWIRLPTLTRTRNPPTLAAFQQFLADNTHLEVLDIQLEEREPYIWHAWMTAIQQGLAKNKSLKRLRFENWFKDGRGETMRTILEYREGETSLVLENFQLSDQELVERLQLAPIHVDCLRLENGYPEDQLNFQMASPIDFVVDFLNRASSLKRLEIDDYHIDPLSLFGAIEKHPSLKCLSVDFGFLESFLDSSDSLQQMTSTAMVHACLEMVQKNMTLEQCFPWNKHDPQIQFYLDYNRFGRSRVRKAGNTCSDLVDLLAAVQQSKSWSATEDGAAARISTTFALLQEMPMLWRNSHVGGIQEV